MADKGAGGFGFFMGMIIGGVAGAAAAVMLTPRKGEEMRHQIVDMAGCAVGMGKQTIDQAQQMGQQAVDQAQDMSKQMTGKVQEMTGRTAERTPEDMAKQAKETTQESTDRAREISEKMNEMGPSTRVTGEPTPGE
jgi:gas vesicle protein